MKPLKNNFNAILLRGLVVFIIASIVIVKCSGTHKKPKVPSVIKAKAADAEPIGSESCAGCHEDVFDALKESGGVHRLILTEPSGEGYCESCHGNGGKHMESMDPADTFTKEDMKKLTKHDENTVCLLCHQAVKTGWMHSPHDGDQVSCWDCHGDAIHGEPESFGIAVKPAKAFAAEGSSEFCGQCHEDVKMQFLMQYHHPVPKGGVDCTSCHAVHGEADKVETAGEPADVCTSCHTEMAGPWVFEHEALLDGCQACHDPHGSANRKMISMDNNVLCLQCHFQTTFPNVNGMNHEVFVGEGATCWQCHFEVHGSNSSPSFSPGW